MSTSNVVGARLIVSTIDHWAAVDPDRVYASIPANNNNLAEGFLNVTYKQLANAINHASWWLDVVLGVCEKGSFDTFAYAGPKDLRYPILAVAAAKVGRRILLPSPFATPEAPIHLLEETKTEVYLCAASDRESVTRLIKDRKDIRTIEVPEERGWIFAQATRNYPYEETWEEAKNDPWIIFHTSGTTGLPKPIVYTNLMMTSLDATMIMPESTQELQTHHYTNERWYSPLPFLHFVGMTTVLQMTVLLNMVAVFGPANPSATATVVDQMLKLGNVAGMILPPSILEEICRNPTMPEQVRKLKFVHYAGAPLNKATGDSISGHVKLVSALGSTEAGPYYVKCHGEPEWNYHEFCPSIGLEFEPRTKDTFEAVFHRKQGLERWQQIFTVYPHLDRFPTNDLMTRHPKNPNLWAYAGRSDDLVILSDGNNLLASHMEAIIMGRPEVRAAFVGGGGKAKPFLILDLAIDRPELTASHLEEDLIERVWAVVDEANEGCTEAVRLTKELTILANPAKPFVWTAKGTVMRKATIELYGNQLDCLYDACSR